MEKEDIEENVGLCDYEIAPLTKEILEECKKMGVEKFMLEFRGGSDEGLLEIDFSREKFGGWKIGEWSPDLNDWSVAELKETLRIKGLPVSGKKTELIERILEMKKLERFWKERKWGNRYDLLPDDGEMVATKDDRGYTNWKRIGEFAQDWQRLEQLVEDWADKAYLFNGAGEGHAYGMDIEYDLVNMKTFNQEWAFEYTVTGKQRDSLQTL